MRSPTVTNVHVPLHDGMVRCPQCQRFNILTEADAHPRIPGLAYCHYCRNVLDPARPDGIIAVDSLVKDMQALAIEVSEV